MVATRNKTQIKLLFCPLAMFDRIDARLDNCYLKLTESILAYVEVLTYLLETLRGHQLCVFNHWQGHVKLEDALLLRKRFFEELLFQVMCWLPKDLLHVDGVNDVPQNPILHCPEYPKLSAYKAREIQGMRYLFCLAVSQRKGFCNPLTGKGLTRVIDLIGYRERCSPHPHVREKAFKDQRPREGERSFEN